jgi:hypothetical protein
MKSLLVLLLLLAVVLPTAAAQPLAGPDLFEPGTLPPTPPMALQAPTSTPLEACYPILADPNIDVDPAKAASPWDELTRSRLFDTNEFYSSPGSFSLRANRDGDPTSGSDVDAFGQQFTLTTTLSMLRGSLYYRYAKGTPQPGDQLLVELYEPGKINASGLVTTALELTSSGRVEDSWQYLSWEVTEPEVISYLQALDSVVLVFKMVSGGSPGSTILWLDNLSAELCIPTAIITGKVTRGGVAAPGALMTLLAISAGGTSVVAQTRTAVDGAYDFNGVPPQSTGVSYQVWFFNRPAALPRPSGQLGFWASPKLPPLSAGTTLTMPTFDIGDVTLQSPASYAEVVATSATPAVLRWGGRTPRQGERQRLCLYDPARGDATTGLPVQICGPLIDPNTSETSFRLAPSSFSTVPSFGFRYERSYRWYVVIYAGDPSVNPNVAYGYSFGERAITLLSAPRVETIAPPTPDVDEPTAGVAGADWTLMIYMAADNTIGDPRRAPSVGRPAGQLATLTTLAKAYPRVNLVSYVDSYGPGGAEVCAYPAGSAADCRTRAEVNSADPATLTDFISYGRSRYPATHTALLIVAPGQAAGDLALDETAAGAPTMSLAELQTAYMNAGLSGATKLDIVIYQAPLMGSAEVLRATAPYARYMVASPEQVWQLGPYRELVPLMAGSSKGDPAAVARAAVGAYSRTIGVVGGTRAYAWAAYDLSRASALDAALNAEPGGLAFEILGYLNASQATVTRPALAAARAAAQSYDSSGNGRLDSLATAKNTIPVEEDALVDVRDLVSTIQTTAGMPDSIIAKAKSLATLLDDASTSPVIAASARSGQSISGAPINLTQSHGLAIFFASGERLGGQPALAEAALYQSISQQPGNSNWADMVRIYLTGAPGAGPGGATEAAGGGYQARPLAGGFVSNSLYLPVVGQ